MRVNPGSAAVPRRRGPYQDGRSWSGLSLTAAGAVAGGVLSIAALVIGLYALAYADGSVRFGGYDYGCEDPVCSSGHMLAGVLCFASIGLYVVLAIVALATSMRMLRFGMRLALTWAVVIVVASLVVNSTIGWLWLVVLAVPPLLLGWGSRQRLRAKQR